jgi:hypothetical protein
MEAYCTKHQLTRVGKEAVDHSGPSFGNWNKEAEIPDGFYPIIGTKYCASKFPWPPPFHRRLHCGIEDHAIGLQKALCCAMSVEYSRVRVVRSVKPDREAVSRTCCTFVWKMPCRKLQTRRTTMELHGI